MYYVLSIVQFSMTIQISDNFLKHYILSLLFIDFRSSFVTDSSDLIIIKNILDSEAHSIMNAHNSFDLIGYRCSNQSL